MTAWRSLSVIMRATGCYVRLMLTLVVEHDGLVAKAAVGHLDQQVQAALSQVDRSTVNRRVDVV
jgi:hypothetical protein